MHSIEPAIIDGSSSTLVGREMVFFVFWPFWQCQAQLNSLTQNWGMHIAVIFIYFGNALCLSHNNMYMYSI